MHVCSLPFFIPSRLMLRLHENVNANVSVGVDGCIWLFCHSHPYHCPWSLMMFFFCSVRPTAISNSQPCRRFHCSVFVFESNKRFSSWMNLNGNLYDSKSMPAFSSTVTLHTANGIPCIVSPFFTLSKLMRYFFNHMPFIEAPRMSTSKYQIFSLSLCAVQTLTCSHLICFRFLFQLLWLWRRFQHFMNNVRKLPPPNNHMSVFSHPLLSVSTICLSTSLSLIYLSHSIVFFFVCLNGDECGCMCMCWPVLPLNRWAGWWVVVVKQTHEIEKFTLFIFWVVDQMPIHSTKANEVYAINW